MIKCRIALAALLLALLLGQPLRIRRITYTEGEWRNTIWIRCSPQGYIGEGPFLILHLEGVYLGD